MQIGFEAIDLLAQINGISWGKKLEHGAIVATGSIHGSRVILCKPMKFMNNSGESVAPLAKYYKVPLDKVRSPAALSGLPRRHAAWSPVSPQTSSPWHQPHHVIWPRSRLENVMLYSRTS